MNELDLNAELPLRGLVRQAGIAILVLLAMASWLNPSSWAQRESASTQESQHPSNQENAQPDLADPKALSQDPSQGTPILSDEPPIREIGKAGLLTEKIGQLRWGSIFLRSVGFVQAFGNGSFGGARRQDVVTSLFQATVAYDKQFRHSRLALQYHPFAGITNGQSYTNFGNRGVEFQTDYHWRLNPRWSMNVTEALAYHGAGNQYTESSYFNVDTVTATAVHNNFLEGPFESLSSSTSLNFVRALSPRTHFSFGPHVGYGYSRGGYQTNVPISSPAYGGVATLEHALSPTRGIGVFYSFERINVSRTFANTTYQTLGASYSQQLAPTWRVSVSAGASNAEFLGQRQLSANGSFNLTKAFQRSYISLSYSRGHSFSGYINNGQTERSDAGYGFPLTRRMGTQFAAGYEYTTSTLSSRSVPRAKISGTYMSAQVNYQLSRGLSWFASYVLRRQTSNDLQVFPGSRDLVITGITWSPSGN